MKRKNDKKKNECVHELMFTTVTRERSLSFFFLISFFYGRKLERYAPLGDFFFLNSHNREIRPTGRQDLIKNTFHPHCWCCSPPPTCLLCSSSS